MSVTILVSGSRDLTLTPRRIEHIERAIQCIVRTQALSDPTVAAEEQLALFGTRAMPVNSIDTSNVDVTLFHGDCRGIDRAAADYATLNHWAIRAFPAQWHIHGRSAGPIRNQEMINASPDILIAFPSAPKSKGSRGTWDCVKRAYEAGIPTLISYHETLFVYSSDNEHPEYESTINTRSLKLTPGTRTIA